MKKIILFFFFSTLLLNCSLNTNSKYWTEENQITKKKDLSELKKIKLKSSDITQMTWEEYIIYLRDYTINSNYPDLSK